MTRLEFDDREWQQWMILALDGDKLAYDRLLRAVAQRLKDYVARRVGIGGDSEDVLQTILISIHMARHTYDRNRPFAPWLFAIAKRRVCDYWRRASQKSQIFIEATFEEHTEPPGPEADGNSNNDFVEDMLSRLRGGQRHVVELLKIRGLSLRETAKALNMTEASVKITAHRAYKVLRASYEKEKNEYR